MDSSSLQQPQHRRTFTLQEVEALCRVIYGPRSSPQERFHAHQSLLFMQIDAGYADNCQYILQHSTEPTALLYAAQALESVMKNDWTNLSGEKRLELRDFLFKLISMGSSKNFLTRKLIQVLCELTRRAWVEDPRMREIIDGTVGNLMRTQNKGELGLRLLKDLVTEFDQCRNYYYEESTRRASQAFLEQQDSGLHKCFHIAVDAVWASRESRNCSLLCESLRCLLACLSFDFAGTGWDEGAAGVHCVYLPKTWVNSIATGPVIKQLFSLYVETWNMSTATATTSTTESGGGAHSEVEGIIIDDNNNNNNNNGMMRNSPFASQNPLQDARNGGGGGATKHRFASSSSSSSVTWEDAASLTLQCLVLIAATRRSVYDAVSRQVFLGAFMEGTTSLLMSRLGFDRSEECLHNACRLVARTKLNSQVSEIVADPSFPQWITAVKDFTCEALYSWSTVSPRSVSYLLEFWQSMVAPFPFVKTSSASSSSPQDTPNPANLNMAVVIVPIFEAYMHSRADMCEAAVARDPTPYVNAALDVARRSGFAPKTSGGDVCDVEEVDPLVSEDTLLDELSGVVTMARFRYPASAEIIGRIIVNAVSIRPVDAKAQARLALVMYLVGALIGGPVNKETAAATKQMDDLNMELAAMCFRLVLERQSGDASPSTFKLEMGTLYFLQCFQYLLIESRTRAQVARVEAKARRARRWPAALMDDSMLNMMSWGGARRLPSASQVAAGSGEHPEVVVMGMSGSFVPGSSHHHHHHRNSGLASVPSSPASNSNGDNNSNNNNIGSLEDDNAMVRVSPVLPRPTRSFERAGLFSIEEADDDDDDDDDTSASDADDVPILVEGGGSSALAAAVAASGTSSSSSSSRMFPSRYRRFEGGNEKSHVIVDELDAMEAGDAFLSETARLHASNVQRTVIDRLGGGGDRTLLDIAVRHVFSVLESAHSHQYGRAADEDEHSSLETVLLVERALGVLRKLAQGSSIVHSGTQFSPKVVSSGLLLLESDFIQELLRNPAPERFSLLAQPLHGRARSFLMATLTSLFFLQIDTPGGGFLGGVGETSGMGHHRRRSRDEEEDVARALLSPAERAEDRFAEFMAPFTTRCDILLEEMMITANGAPGSFPPPTLKHLVTGLFRDLRGVVASAEEARHYELVFVWFFPHRVRLLVEAARRWWEDPGVMVPALRLLAELVANKGSRISFPMNSTGGQALVLEACRVLEAWAVPHAAKLEARLQAEASAAAASLARSAGPDGVPNTLSLAALQAVVEELTAGASAGAGMDENGRSGGGPAATRAGGTTGRPVRLAPGAMGLGITVNPIASELKCLSIVCNILTRIIAGRYANLSVFELYGDLTFKSVKRLALQLTLAGVPENLAAYPKAEMALVLLAHIVADTAPAELVCLPTPLFARLVACLSIAVSRASSVLSTPAAFAVESLAVLKCRAVLYAQSTAVAASSNSSSSSSTSSSNAADGIGNNNKASSSPTAYALRPHGFKPSVFSPSSATRTRVFTSSELAELANHFRMHEEAQPHLFPDFLRLLLDRLLTSPDYTLPNLYAIARPIPPLAIAHPGALGDYVTGFIACQSPHRQKEVAEHLKGLFRILLPHYALPGGGGGHPGGETNEGPALVADVLRRNEEITKDLCKMARKWRETFANEL